jgi:hypothetical protein
VAGELPQARRQLFSAHSGHCYNMNGRELFMNHNNITEFNMGAAA